MTESTPCLIHLEHAIPVLTDLGLEHLLPLLLQGGEIQIEGDTLRNLLQGVQGAAEKHAARRLVAISRATAAQLLTWETNAAAKTKAEDEAAVAGLAEAQEAVSGFFASCGISLSFTPGSSEIEGKPTENPQKVEENPEIPG